MPKVVFKTEYGNIKELNLSKNQIIELEARVFLSLPMLKILNASNNKLKYISGKIENCKQLECLILDKNDLQMLPLEIGRLKFL